MASFFEKPISIDQIKHKYDRQNSNFEECELSYFGVRKVGDTVARVHELENIRNFLTGSTLTLIIDFFFTIIFFTVMFFYSTTLTLIILLPMMFG